jgi:photosystem II stability/assembly factor-like uncharacterized protein
MNINSLFLSMLFLLFVTLPRPSIGQWVHVNIPTTSGVLCLAVDGDRLFAGTDSNGVFLSTDRGETWTTVNQELANENVYALTFYRGKLFAGTLGSGIFTSTNFGLSWTPPDSTAASLGVHHFVVSGTTLYAIIGYYVPPGSAYRTTDNGSSWSPFGGLDGVGDLIAVGSSIFASNYGYAPHAGFLGGVYVSTDDGTNWTEEDHGLPGVYPWGVGAYVKHFLLEGTKVFAGLFAMGVYSTEDGGANWTDVTNGLPDSNVTQLYEVNRSIFACTYGKGVFFSTNDGANWYAWNEGLTTTAGFLGICSDDSNLYICATNMGLWRRPLSEITTSVQVNEKGPPSVFTLSQNFPNPFNPSTTITYQLPTNTLVILKVYDVLGREVQALVNERQNKGNHSVTFNGINLPSGVYFYGLNAGTYHDTKKLLLLK